MNSSNFQSLGRLAGPTENAEAAVSAHPFLWLFIAAALGYAVGIVTAPGARMFSR